MVLIATIVTLLTLSIIIVIRRVSLRRTMAKKVNNLTITFKS